MVTFRPVGTDCTRVALMMEFLTERHDRKIGDATKMVDRRVEGHLKRFKEFIESRGQRDRRLAWHGLIAPLRIR